MTDASLVRLASGCPLLESLDVSHGGLGVTDAGVVELAALQHLRSVNVMDCGAVTGRSIATLLMACVHLTPSTLKADTGDAARI